MYRVEYAPAGYDRYDKGSAEWETVCSGDTAERTLLEFIHMLNEGDDYNNCWLRLVLPDGEVKNM